MCPSITHTIFASRYKIERLGIVSPFMQNTSKFIEKGEKMIVALQI
jgi:hypothetical protein